MNFKNKIKIMATLGAAAIMVSAASASALTIGVYSESGGAETAAGSIIAGQGHTFVNLSSLSAASLSTLDIAWYMNSSNSAQGQIGNAAAISSFVSGGNVFVMNDRRVTGAGGILPGGGGITFTRDFSDDADIQVIDGSTSLTSGPGGIIGNTTLDNGTSSSHGFALSASLPGAALEILSRSAANEIVDFTYMFGAGAVHYSTVPLDFYMGGSSNFAAIYAPNLVAYAADTWEAKNTPTVAEPGTLAILGLGLAGLGFARRKLAA